MGQCFVPVAQNHCFNDPRLARKSLSEQCLQHHISKSSTCPRKLFQKGFSDHSGIFDHSGILRSEWDSAIRVGFSDHSGILQSVWDSLTRSKISEPIRSLLKSSCQLLDEDIYFVEINFRQTGQHCQSPSSYQVQHVHSTNWNYYTRII